MKIIHLSDTHITNHSIWDTDTVEHFDRAVELISHYKNIDAIVITGDLSDDGSEWSYEYIDKTLSPLNIPVLCCIGNHDDPIKMLNSNWRVLRVEKKFYINGWKIISLDSTIKGMARGVLNLSELSYLEKELKEQLPTIICLHHPPIKAEGWLNRKPLENRNDLNSIIAKTENVKLVLYGHIHTFSHYFERNIQYCSAPAIGFAYNKDLPKYQIAKGEEGFSIITINDVIKIQYIQI